MSHLFAGFYRFQGLLQKRQDARDRQAEIRAAESLHDRGVDSYHLSLHISYPRQQDEENARNKGVSPGGNIFVHGLPNGVELTKANYKGRDWTDGCIAVQNSEIEEIWSLVKDGTPIEILK